MSDPVFQNSFYIGNIFNGILYGVELVLYFMTMQKLLRLNSMSIHHDAHREKRSYLFFMLFSTALLFLTTIYVATQSVFGEEMWIVNADFPGGSDAYMAQYASVWYETMGTASNVLLNLLTDGLLIYRCYVVWTDLRVIIVPCIFWIATIGLGVAELYASGSPSGDYFTGLALHVGVAYYSVSIGLNVIVTSIICGRILYFAKRTKSSLGGAHGVRGVSSSYYSVASIIIESALPYTLFSIAFLVSYGVSSQVSILFMSLYIMFTCISPQMLVLRVVAGRGWTRDKATATTSGPLSFSTRTPIAVISTSETCTHRDDGTVIHLNDFTESNSDKEVKNRLE